MKLDVCFSQRDEYGIYLVRVGIKKKTSRHMAILERWIVGNGNFVSLTPPLQIVMQ